MHFQDIIFYLQQFWAKHGCVILQPHDLEVGAGTSHPATVLRCLSDSPWNVAYVQPSRRPMDGRYAENPNRCQHFYQFQVILKGGITNGVGIERCLQSLAGLGIDERYNDIRVVESDWANPTLGAWGLGWEIWCNGMEIIQFTYMQQIGGIECKPVPCEITYGLERVAMYVQGQDNIWNLTWNDQGVTYQDIFAVVEKQQCHYNFTAADVPMLRRHFVDHLSQAQNLIKLGLIYPAYEQCLKASHNFNLIEARGAFSVTEREHYMSEVRQTVRFCCQEWEKQGNKAGVYTAAA